MFALNKTAIKRAIQRLFSACSLIVLMFPVWAQHEIHFIGRDNLGGSVPLHHVVVENVSRGWLDTLFYPDLTLLLTNVGIHTYMEEDFSLSHNTPNPFSGVTDFAVTLYQNDPLDIEVVDLKGRKVADFSQQLEAGIHTFRVCVSTPQPYVVNVRTSRNAASIKILNVGKGGDNRITYIEEKKMQKSGCRGSHPYMMGDLMRIIGFVALENGDFLASEVVEQSLDESCTVTLVFNLFSTLTVETGNCIETTYHEAVCEGNVISDGLLPVTSCGICWNTSGNPTLTDNHTIESPCVGAFTSTLTNLTAGETYHYRAYATNAISIFYGSDAVMTTVPYSVPSVTTGSISNNDGYSATCGGIVTDNGGSPIIEKGVCWCPPPNTYPLITDFHTVSTDIGDTFSCNLTGLTPGTTYYVRTYATNAAGISYGDRISFRTASIVSPHLLNLNDTTNISINAKARLNIGTATYQTKGFCWSTSPNPTLADSVIVNTSPLDSWFDYTNTITGLDPGTTYYIRAFATTVVGTGYSSQMVFTTQAHPHIETDSVIVLADSVVLTGGNILNIGHLSITDAGVCWSTSPGPTCNDRHVSVNDTIGHFQLTLTGLSVDSIYYLRAYATNSCCTGYGQEYQFRARVNYGLPCPGSPTVSDIDGNVYKTVQLGTQCWMAENLRTTHFADSTFIPLGTWGTVSHFSYYRYYPNGDSTNVDVYGYLYNWKTAMHGANSSGSNPSGIQGICPNGWHFPSKAEWRAMLSYVSSQSQYVCSTNTNNIAKSLASTSGWQYSSGGCNVGYFQITNNETGFNAFPAGGMYMNFGNIAAFWCATASYSSGYGGSAYLYDMRSELSDVNELDEEQWYQWHSVRCVKN